MSRQFDTIERGATYAIIAYDTQDNLPQRTLIAREKNVLIAVVDIKSGIWNMAREIFEVLQKEMTSKKKTVNEINIMVVQEMATDIGALVKYTSNIRGKIAKQMLQNTYTRQKGGNLMIFIYALTQSQ